MPEAYIFKFKAANSPRLFQVVINQLVGEDEARRFWKTYRLAFIILELINAASSNASLFVDPLSEWRDPVATAPGSVTIVLLWTQHSMEDL